MSPSWTELVLVLCSWLALLLCQVGRIGDKLKRTEEHLLRLLSLRKQQSAAERAKARAGAPRRGGATSPGGALLAGSRSGTKGGHATGSENGTPAGKRAASPAIRSLSSNNVYALPSLPAADANYVFD